MNYYKKVKHKIRIAVAGMLTSGKELSRLCNVGEAATIMLTNAIDAAKRNRCSEEENSWIKKIETLRKTLNSSSKEITIVDYGAGLPDIKLTVEEMYKGQSEIITIGELCRGASKTYKWDLLLFKLIREFRPSVCLELGTALAISAAYQSAACELNDHGKVVTLEGSESLVTIDRENLKNLGLKRVEIVPGRFQDTLKDVLNENGIIDFVFVDGHHDEDATLTYFRQIVPYLSEGAILVFDDIYWSDGMERAWDKVQNDKNIEVSIDLFHLGICIYTKLTEGKNMKFRIVI